MNKKEILALITALGKNPDHLTKQHLKKIYAILIACGHYPICPWCNEPIYNINDFSWDHIIPRALGGEDTLANLQPMHKHCNNEDKQATTYQTEYKYDIQSDLQETIYNVRITISKKRAQTNKQTKKQINKQKDTTTINIAKTRKIKNNVKRR